MNLQQNMNLKKNKPAWVSPVLGSYSRVLRGLLACVLMATVANSHAERADREQRIQLEAARVSIDDAKQVSTFEGEVQLSQGTMTIRGDKIVVTQDKNGLKHGTATGKLASFRQKREGFDEYVEGYAERIEYDSQRETVDFFGQARMQRGQDEITGDHITYNSRTEIFQALSTPSNDVRSGGKGRVRVIIQPKKKSESLPPADPISIKPSGSLTTPESNS